MTPHRQIHRSDLAVRQIRSDVSGDIASIVVGVLLGLVFVAVLAWLS